MSPVINVVSQFWRVLIPIAFVLISDGVPNGIVLLLIVPIVAVGGAISWIGWRRFTYALRDGALVVESGVFNRRRREVPLGRIQQVDVRRNLVQRLFGLSALHVDTASSGAGAEVVLASLDERDAIALHQLLLDRRFVPDGQVFPGGPLRAGSIGPVAPGTPAPPVGRPLVRLGTRDLVVAALTGRALGVGVAAVIALLSAFGEAITAPSIGTAFASVVFIGVLVAIGIVLVLGSAVITTVLANSDFTLERIGTDLHLRRGLLEQRQTTLALHRVQCVRIHENLLRRAFGLCSVDLQSAGSGGTSGGNEQSSLDSTRVTIPLLRTAQLATLLPDVLPFDDPIPSIEPAPPVARRRRVTRAAVAIVLAVIIATTVSILVGVWWPWVVAAVVAAVAIGWVEPSYRALGSGLGDDVVVARSGAYLRETAIVPMARLQSVSLQRSPLQARSGIATLRLDVAGDGQAPHIIDQTRTRLVEIRAAALFDDSTRADERRARDRTRRAARAESSPPA